MPVRKTESRLPDGFTANDLGQFASSEDNGATLISYIISPIVLSRPNIYVVFITNNTIAASVSSYEWTITQGGTIPQTEITTVPELLFTPSTLGPLTIRVSVRDAGNSAISVITMSQEIVQRNTELETLINTAANAPGPGIGNLDVARELVNDHNPYYQQVTLQAPEAGDGFKRFVFSMASEGVLQKPPGPRKTQLDELAAAINSGTGDFVTLTAEGLGVCRIRMALLAMVASGLAWTELPDSTSPRAAADQQLREALAALDENKKIDLFNLVRFPKSNIVQCGRILEALRNRYFAGANFNDVLTGMQGTRAHWISRHYKEGPIAT